MFLRLSRALRERTACSLDLEIENCVGFLYVKMSRNKKRACGNEMWLKKAHVPAQTFLFQTYSRTRLTCPCHRQTASRFRQTLSPLQEKTSPKVTTHRENDPLLRLEEFWAEDGDCSLSKTFSENKTFFQTPDKQPIPTNKNIYMYIY